MLHEASSRHHYLRGGAAHSHTQCRCCYCLLSTDMFLNDINLCTDWNYLSEAFCPPLISSELFCFISCNVTSITYSLFHDTFVIVDNILCCSGEYTTVLCVATIMASLNAVNCPSFGSYGNGHCRVKGGKWRKQRGGGRRFTLFWFLLLWGRHAEGSRGRRRWGGVGGRGRGGPGECAVKLRWHEDILLTLPSTLRQAERKQDKDWNVRTAVNLSECKTRRHRYTSLCYIRFSVFPAMLQAWQTARLMRPPTRPKRLRAWTDFARFE